MGFGLRQLVNIVLKALSPGINDITTAVMCVDRLGELLRLLAGRDLASPLRATECLVRVLTIGPDFSSYLDTAFDQVRANAASTLAIYLRQQADLTLAAAEANLTAHYDLNQVQARYRELRDDLMGLPEAVSE